MLLAENMVYVCVVSQREGREVCFLCKCSFLEIYKEVITDLLNPAATRLHIRENLQQGVHVEGLSQETVTSGKQPTGTWAGGRYCFDHQHSAMHAAVLVITAGGV